jgi:hypothetical protein
MARDLSHTDTTDSTDIGPSQMVIFIGPAEMKELVPSFST